MEKRSNYSAIAEQIVKEEFAKPFFCESRYSPKLKNNSILTYLHSLIIDSCTAAYEEHTTCENKYKRGPKKLIETIKVCQIEMEEEAPRADLDKGLEAFYKVVHESGINIWKGSVIDNKNR